jgi:hypothetical protein
MVVKTWYFVLSKNKDSGYLRKKGNTCGKDRPSEEGMEIIT